MKNTISNYEELNKLSIFIKSYLDRFNAAQLVKNRTCVKDKNPLEVNEQKLIWAKKTIHRFWEKVKLKNEIKEMPYEKYLSWIDDQDKEKLLLSAIMYGRHQAEISEKYFDAFNNPFIHEKAFYYRDDNIQGILLKKLLELHKINLQSEQDCIPVTQLHNLTIADVINCYFSQYKEFIKIVKNNSLHTCILVYPKIMQINDPIKEGQIKTVNSYEVITKVLQSLGLKASPWEIAIDVKQSKELLEKLPKYQHIKLDTLFINNNELHASHLFKQLERTAQNKSLLTHYLAESLVKILKKSPALELDALQRIAQIINLANTFYLRNYAYYAISVYSILHEISLALINQSSEEQIKQRFDDFYATSKKQFQNSLGLADHELDKYVTAVAPATSGTNAYALALQLSAKMHTANGEKPKIKAVGPEYFEFQYVTLNRTEHEADIYTICAGPIVTKAGVVPGTDINKLIMLLFPENEALNAKPITIIIDVTCALYENLKLSTYTKSLIQSGRFSLIINESYQKFGLLHSDQSQCGRVHAICSKNDYSAENIKEFKDNAYKDFSQHPDMQIGTFIFCAAGETLEKIKKQHFENGALLRHFMINTQLMPDIVTEHKHMLENKDELYFITIANKLGIKLENTQKRDSFGHYRFTTATISDVTRLSPSATDCIDSLIEATKIYLRSKGLGTIIYCLQQQPFTLTNYKNSYILGENQELYYVDTAMKLRSITIEKENSEKINSILLKIKQQNASQVYLNAEDYSDLIKNTSPSFPRNEIVKFLYAYLHECNKNNILALEKQIIMVAFLLTHSDNLGSFFSSSHENIPLYFAIKKALKECWLLSDRGDFSKLVAIKSTLYGTITEESIVRYSKCRGAYSVSNENRRSLDTHKIQTMFKALEIVANMPILLTPYVEIYNMFHTNITLCDLFLILHKKVGSNPNMIDFLINKNSVILKLEHINTDKETFKKYQAKFFNDLIEMKNESEIIYLKNMDQYFEDMKNSPSLDAFFDRSLSKPYQSYSML